MFEVSEHHQHDHEELAAALLGGDPLTNLTLRLSGDPASLSAHRGEVRS